MLKAGKLKTFYLEENKNTFQNKIWSSNLNDGWEGKKGYSELPKNKDNPFYLVYYSASKT